MRLAKVVGFRLGSKFNRKDPSSELYSRQEEKYVNSFSGNTGIIHDIDLDPDHPYTLFFPNRAEKYCRFAENEIELG